MKPLIDAFAALARAIPGATGVTINLFGADRPHFSVDTEDDANTYAIAKLFGIDLHVVGIDRDGTRISWLQGTVSNEDYFIRISGKHHQGEMPRVETAMGNYTLWERIK